MCITYNQEKLLPSALDGFISQICDFRYEIIVHDDASTDRTQQVLREYAEKYPDMIIPIYQEVNQLSQAVDILAEHIQPIAKGKYLAFCEGDDYWIDPYKLQKQVDYMEAHPDCTICFTNAYTEDVSNQNKREVFIPCNAHDRQYYGIREDYTLHNFHELEFVPTASLLFRADEYCKMIEDPCFIRYESVPCRDKMIRLFLTAGGYAHFLDENACVYRINVHGSQLTQRKTYTREKKCEREKRNIRMLINLDKYSKGEYTDGINKIMEGHIRRTLLIDGCPPRIRKQQPYLSCYQKLSLKEKIKVQIKMRMPESVLQKEQRLHERLKK